MIKVLRLKELRKQKGLNQTSFAKAFGVAQNTVSNWENGNRMLDTATANEIAKFFGVSVDYLLGNEQKKNPPEKDGERKITDEELKFALWGGVQDIDDEDLADVKRYAAFVKERKKDNQK